MAGALDLELKPFIFAIEAPRVTSDTTAEVDFTFTPLPGHYIYKDRMRAKVTSPEGVSIEELVMPAPKVKYDKFLEKEVKIYDGITRFTAKLKVPGREAVANQVLELRVRYEGCSPTLCFLPQTADFEVAFGAGGAEAGTSDVTVPSQSDEDGPLNETLMVHGTPALRFIDAAGKEFKGERLDGFVKAKDLRQVISRVADGKGAYEAKPGLDVSLVTFLVIFAGGLLLSLTPCVWPMIPITTSIVLGSKKPGTGMGFVLSGSYVLGMALVYAIAGTVIASVGGLMGSFLQSPYVLVGVAGLFVAMALSMFGLYDLPMTGAGSGKFGGGSVAASFVLGGVSALVLSPCIGPVVASLLLYVAQTGNAALGGLMLFVFGLGVGAPLVAIGTFSGAMQKRPKAGAWMVEVKKLFGVALLGFAVYFLMPLLNGRQMWMLAGGAAVAVGAGFILFDVSRNFGASLAKAKLALSVVVIIGGILVAAVGPGGAVPEGGIAWRYSYEDARKEAAEQDKPMMIYFTSGSCTSCKQLKLYTFPDEDVIRSAKGVVPVEIDLTSLLEGDADFE